MSVPPPTDDDRPPPSASPVDTEESLLRSAAMQNAHSILAARQRAEYDLLRAKEALELRSRELASSLSLMRATLESTFDGIVVTDLRGGVTAYNEQYARLWQMPADLLALRDHRKLLDRVAQQFADPDGFLARVDAIYTEGPPESFEVLERADGRAIERYSRNQVIEGEVVGRVWSFRDITERKRAEDALRDESGVLELLNRTGMWLASELDRNVLVQAATDAATQLAGAEFGAFIEPPGDQPAGSANLFAMSGAGPPCVVDLGAAAAADWFPGVSAGVAPVRSDDVTADPRFATWCLTACPDDAPPPLRSYLSVPVVARSGELIGQLHFCHSQRAIFNARAERIVAGVAAQAAVALDNARLYAGAQRAAAERQQLLSGERRAREEAERMSAMKDEFLATLSHELRTPLSAILGWSQLLRHRKMEPAEVARSLETIERNARVQTQLIEDLLDMSRITSGKLRLDVQRVDPIHAVEAALATVAPAAAARSIRVETMLDPRAGPLQGDSDRLQQIMWNLLSNAIKFTPKEGKVQVLLRRVDSAIEIVVADTGIGIAPEFLGEVFDRFRQADSSTTRRYGGLGLGLSIVKHLVELHGGSVEAASAGEGQGATFTVRMPLTVVLHNASVAAGRHPRTGAPLSTELRAADLTGMTVLVVDDEQDARDLIEAVLADCHARVVVAASAAEALALVQRERPDVLVSDIGMPGMDGYELLRRVRALGVAQGGAVPAIALTAFARSEDRMRALRAGFRVHVAKPVDPAELVATVASVAGRTPATD